MKGKSKGMFMFYRFDKLYPTGGTSTDKGLSEFEGIEIRADICIIFSTAIVAKS